jgi:hypothetical protein
MNLRTSNTFPPSLRKSLNSNLFILDTFILSLKLLLENRNTRARSYSITRLVSLSLIIALAITLLSSILASNIS